MARVLSWLEISRPPGPPSAGSGEAAGATAGGGRAALGCLPRPAGDIAGEGRVLLVERLHPAPGADQAFRPLSHALQDLEAVAAVAAAIFVDRHRRLTPRGSIADLRPP